MFRSACQHFQRSSPFSFFSFKPTSEDVKEVVDVYKRHVAGISFEGRLWDHIDIEWAPEAINTYEKGVKSRFRGEKQNSERL